MNTERDAQVLGALQQLEDDLDVRHLGAIHSHGLVEADAAISTLHCARSFLPTDAAGCAGRFPNMLETT